MRIVQKRRGRAFGYYWCPSTERYKRSGRPEDPEEVRVDGKRLDPPRTDLISRAPTALAGCESSLSPFCDR